MISYLNGAQSKALGATGKACRLLHSDTTYMDRCDPTLGDDMKKGTFAMRTLATLCFVGLISMSLSACDTLPQSFSTEKVMKVHQGMSSDQILSMFGKPKNIRVAVCGQPPNQWTCTTWEYRGYFDDRASFTFNGEPDHLWLNNFSVDR
jgi:hypothetical protein